MPDTRSRLTTAGNDKAAQQFHDETGILGLQIRCRRLQRLRRRSEENGEDFGPIEVLVNNAEITSNSDVHRMSHEHWNAVIQTNLSLVLQHVAGRSSTGCGREALAASSISVRSTDRRGNTVRSTTPPRNRASTALRRRWRKKARGSGITVNAVAPGYVDTEMVRAVPAEVIEKIIARIPVGRLGKAEDIARTVLFLVADDADFITGSTLSVNGGQHMY